MDNFIEEQRAVNVQANQEINTVESSLNKELVAFQSEIDEKFDILQQSISKLTNQLVHQEEEDLEGEWLIDTILGEQTQLQQVQEELMQEPVEAPEELPVEEAGGGRGKEAGEDPQKLIPQPNPINWNPNATTQPKNIPLPVYILPTAQPILEEPAPAAKAKANPSLPMLQNFKKLVAIVQNFATTSKTLDSTTKSTG